MIFAPGADGIGLPAFNNRQPFGVCRYKPTERRLGTSITLKRKRNAETVCVVDASCMPI